MPGMMKNKMKSASKRNKMGSMKKSMMKKGMMKKGY